MADVIHEHTTQKEGNDMGFLLGVVMLVVVLVLFFYFAVPYLRNISFSSPQINVPSKIDVNIKQEK